MIVTTIGLGLIGGSIALELKANNFADQVIGVDNNPTHQQQALALGLVDGILPLEAGLSIADLVIIATPVDVTTQLLPQILANIDGFTTVLDVGSTKSEICKIAGASPLRDRFVAAHPIAGTENTGPTAAHRGLFSNKTNIICEREKSNPQALRLVEKLFECLRMKNIYMDAAAHDKHIAYVSHLSHISSFTLGLTVLEIEKNEKTIFDMAGSGFESTVRLAKSSPEMWAPIFDQNSENLVVALDEYIHQLQQFKQVIQHREKQQAKNKMKKANDIRRVLAGIEAKKQQISPNTTNKLQSSIAHTSKK